MKKILTIIVMMCSVVATSANANDSELEHHYLSLVIAELKQLQPLLDKAQCHQNTESRYQFNYQLLTDDIEQIIAGIDAKLSDDYQSPRHLPPLIADYVEPSA